MEDFPDLSLDPSQGSPTLINLSQPVLGDETVSRQQQQHHQRHRTGSIDILDVIQTNPLETEAETLILKAIEKQDAKLHRARSNTGNSTSLFDNIPDTAAQMVFGAEHPTVNTTTTKEGPNPTKPTSQPQQHARKESGASLLPPPALFRTSTESSRRSSSAAGSTNKPGTVQRQRTGVNKPKPLHHRQQTMEQKLAGLTVALANLRDNEVDANNNYNDTATSRPTTTENASSGEILAQNATLIFRGRQRTEGKVVDAAETTDGSTGGTQGGKTGATHWKLLKTSVQVANALDRKNSAGGSPTAADLQQGMSPQNGPPLQVTTGPMEVYKKTDGENDQSYQMNPEIDEEEGLFGENLVENDTNENAGGEEEEEQEQGDDKNHRSKRMKRPKSTMFGKGLKQGVVRDFSIFFVQRRSSVYNYMMFHLLVIGPAIGIAFILYYLVGTFFGLFLKIYFDCQPVLFQNTHLSLNQRQPNDRNSRPGTFW
jgi:hypothetical protein